MLYWNLDTKLHAAVPMFSGSSCEAVCSLDIPEIDKVAKTGSSYIHRTMYYVLEEL